MNAHRDRDALVRLYADAYEFVDHRKIGWEPRSGPDPTVEAVVSIWDGTTSLSIDIHEVLACDERVLAARITWSGTAKDELGGGDWAFPLGVVIVADGDQATRYEQFEATDSDGMLARYAELAGRPPEVFRAAFKRCFDAHDVDRCVALTAENWVQVDHRKIGWGTSRGRDRARELLESVYQSASDLRMRSGEVLACDDRVIAECGAWLGTADDNGGPFEIPFGMVSVIEDGLRVSEDVYEADDLPAMIARYVELGGGLGVLGGSAPERWWRELGRVFAARELAPLLELFAEDCVILDSRNVWNPAGGRQGAAEIVTSTWEGAVHGRFEFEEVLACDDRVIAVSFEWRGVAIEDVGGGPFVLPTAVVAVIESGLLVRWEHHEPDDREAMLARYAELGGRAPSPLAAGERMSERLTAEFARHYSAHDLEPLLALYHEDFVMTDHRSVGWGALQGREALRQAFGSGFEISPDARFEIGEVIAADAYVIAHTGAWCGAAADGGGEAELPVGLVSVNDGRRIVSTDMYEQDDVGAMIARYAELGGGQRPLGDRPPERHLAELLRRFARRDVDGIVELHHPDWRRRDHRLLGMEELQGRGPWRKAIESVLAASPDVRLEVDEVVAADDRLIAARIAFRGHGRDGTGESESRLGVVDVVEGGLSVSRDQYGYDDDAAMLARYAELGGGGAPLPERPPQRLTAEYVRRWAERDIDRLLELYAPDHLLVDHRALGWEEIRGLDAVAEVLRSSIPAQPHVEIVIDEVLACDDRVIALTYTWLGRGLKAGEISYPLGAVDVVENDLWISCDIFEHEDRQGLIARYAELGGGQGPLGDRPPERFYAEFCRRYARHDLELMLELYVEDFTLVDHRHLGWPEVHNRDGIADQTTSGWGSTLDLRCECDEVLACDDRVIAMRQCFRGHALDGGGELELHLGRVAVVEQGRLVSVDQYEAGDDEAMLARFAELSRGGPPAALGARAPERFFAEYVRRSADRDVDQLAELYAPDYVLIDHRALGWEEVHGRDAIVDVLRQSIPRQPNVEIEIDEVLACEDRVVAMLATWRGEGVKAGEIAYTIGQVNVIEDGRWVSCDIYEPGDREEMMVRFDELLARSQPPGAARARAGAGKTGAWEARFADDVSVIDLRPEGWGALHGAHEAAAQVGNTLAGRALGRQQEATLVALPDGAAAVTFEGRDGQLAWVEVHPDERAGRERFAVIADDLEALLSMRLGIFWFQALNRRDLTAARACLADDMIVADHRPASPFPPHAQGGDAYFAQITSLLELSPDMHWWLAAGGTAAGSLCICPMVLSGHWGQGGGWAEITLSAVTSRDGDRFDRFEFFAPDALAEQQARLAELVAERFHSQ
ncbi:MAG: nuclear transport factor 2 family protein [Solirubrobacteraceae bacterium]